MKKDLRHSLAAPLWQGLLMVFVAAVIGICVNALRPGGLPLYGTAAPVAAVPVAAVPIDAGRGISLDMTRTTIEKSAAVVSGAQNAAAAGPMVHVPSYRFEFATVVEGVDVEHAFIVRNRGSQVLRINQVKPG